MTATCTNAGVWSPDPTGVECSCSESCVVQHSPVQCITESDQLQCRSFVSLLRIMKFHLHIHLQSKYQY